MALFSSVFVIWFLTNINSVYGQTFYCNSKDKCKDKELICNQDGDKCSTYCTAESACSGNSRIVGSYAGDVTVRCTQKDACKGNTIIYCGTGHCEITCAQSTSCEDTTIFASTASSYSCRPTRNCNRAISDRTPFVAPTKKPTPKPTHKPTYKPTLKIITFEPTRRPTNKPIYISTFKPTTKYPTPEPTKLHIVKKQEHDHFPIYEVKTGSSSSSDDGGFIDFNPYFDDITVPSKKPFIKEPDVIKPKEAIIDNIDPLDEKIDDVLPERTQNPSAYPSKKPTIIPTTITNPIIEVIEQIETFTDASADSKEFTVARANPPPTSPSAIIPKKRSSKPSVAVVQIDQMINELNDPIIPPTATETTLEPSFSPTIKPTIFPTANPSLLPTRAITSNPTKRPTDDPSQKPSNDPTLIPTVRVKKPSPKPVSAAPTSPPKFIVTTVPLTVETSRPTLLALIPTARLSLRILPKLSPKPSVAIGDATTNTLAEPYGNLIKAAASTNQLSIFITSLITTGAVSKLLRPGLMSYTVFAPTDDAFNTFMDEMEITLNDMLNLPNLSEILLYHATANEQALTCADLKNMDNEHLSSLNEHHSFEVSVSSTNEIGLIAQRNGVCNVIACDVRAKSGILHVIDRVMLPDVSTKENTMAYDNDDDVVQNDILSDGTAINIKSMVVISLVSALVLLTAMVTLISWWWCRRKNEEGVQISINGEDSDVDDEIMEIIEKISQDTNDF